MFGYGLPNLAAILQLSHASHDCKAGLCMTQICSVHIKLSILRLLPDFTVHDTCPWPLPPEDQRKMFLVRLSYGDLTLGLPDHATVCMPVSRFILMRIVIVI